MRSRRNTGMDREKLQPIIEAMLRGETSKVISVRTGVSVMQLGRIRRGDAYGDLRALIIKDLRASGIDVSGVLA